MLHCDLNCDMGEGLDNEGALVPYISSANIACGAHAGSSDTMKRVIDLCLQHGVAVGAHPSYPDWPGFGRRDMVGAGLRAEDVFDLVTEQVMRLQTHCTQQGALLHHVKPHGALYNRAAWDGEVAFYVCKAISELQAGLFLYGLSGSNLGTTASFLEVPFMHEVFADRTYRADGSLTPRSEPLALIENEEAAVGQVLRMVYYHEAAATTGESVPLKVDTICIHGDSRGAVGLAKKLHALLQAPLQNLLKPGP